MLIDLPETFRLNGKIECDYAEVENGILHIYGNTNFKKLMYEITYCLKGNGHCYYCGTGISKNDSSLDHIYAQIVGGPTIPNNLVPACKTCNSLKSILSCEEFKEYLSLGENEKKKYEEAVRKRIEDNKFNGVFGIPNSWLVFVNVDDIDLRIGDHEICKGKKFDKLREYYKEYHHFKAPVVIDKEKVVVDGNRRIVFAKENKIKIIPAIILENVIVHKQFKG